jgi:hypothetical protein
VFSATRSSRTCSRLTGSNPPDNRIILAEMPTISAFYGILSRMFYNFDANTVADEDLAGANDETVAREPI